jgi:ABC-2 type transport system permease protein
VRDTWLVFLRSIRPTLRNPAVIVFGLMQPLLFLLLFGPLLGGAGSWQWFVPGLIFQMGLFGTAYTGFALIPEIRSGALERMRVTPVHRMALLLGKVLNNAVQLLFQAILILVVALIFFDLNPPSFGGVVLSLLIVVLLGVTMAASSYAVALMLKSEEAFIPLLNTVLLPVLLLSGILIPITTGLAPGWLYTISRINPFTHVMDADRAAFRGDMSVDGLLTGSIVLLVMAALAVWWGARTFQRENAYGGRLACPIGHSSAGTAFRRGRPALVE